MRRRRRGGNAPEPIRRDRTPRQNQRPAPHIRNMNQGEPRMPVERSTLPAHSALRHRLQPGDFIDSFRTRCSLAPRDAALVIADFPPWATALTTLRNLLVRPLGLKTEGPETPDKIGFFPVEAETEDELIAGFDDTHLDFRLSIRRDGPYLYLSTWVHRHNLLGRAYLATILPFHILIARDALLRAGRATPGAPADPKS